MYSVGDLGMVSVEVGRKRLHPDEQDLRSFSSKRYFTVEVEQDCSFPSDAGTITCLDSTGKAKERITWRKGAVDALDRGCSMTSLRASEVSSTSAVVSSTVDCLVDGPTRQRGELNHNGKSKGNFLMSLNSSENRRSDVDLEVNSEVTMQRMSSNDCPVFSIRAANEPSGESVARKVRYRDSRRNKSRVGMPQSMPENDEYRLKSRTGCPRHSDTEPEINDMHWRAMHSIGKPGISIADESGSSCGDPSEDSTSEEEGPSCADADGLTPNLEFSSLVDEKEIAGVFGSRGNGVTPSVETNREWEHFSGFRLAKRSETGGLKELGKEGQTTAQVSYEYVSQLLNDNRNEDSHRPSYVLSSGRMSQEEVARLGRRPPTIDRDFEEYFSSLML